MTVYGTRCAMTKIASRERGQRFVKDAVTVAPSRPARDLVLSTLHPGANVSDSTGPSQGEELVEEEGRQEPKCKRRKPSRSLVRGESTGRGSDLQPCSAKLIRAEDGEPDDLDKEDVTDPYMVPEYQAECYRYMHELEVSGGCFSKWSRLVCVLVGCLGDQRSTYGMAKGS
jgi:hypothetical protein